MIESDSEFSCPYCGTQQTIRLDASGGSKQQFVSDCEVCCQPILICVAFDAESLTGFSAERESE